MKSLSYTERLLRLNLESLESRRAKADLVLLFKVIHGFVDIDYSAMFDMIVPLEVMTFVFVSVILMLMLVNTISVIV